MVKIKDIAKKCQTSIATVSKALHNSSELSKETILRIQKVADEMGYIPNAYARALKMKRSYSIGVIFSDPTAGGLRHEYFSAILDSLKVEAESKGYNITFLSKNPVNKMSYLQMAKYRNMDGVVVVSEKFDNPEIAELVNSGLPTVTIDYIFNNATAIMSDNTEGMEKLVHYVAELGHKKIAYLHGEMTDVTKKRLAGFYKGMKEMGLDVDPSWVIEGRFHDPRTSGRTTKQILSSPSRPTLIFYPDDVSLLGGLTALSQEGIKVPEDISVVGYDGVEISQIYRPSFTTYVQNSEELGKQAAENLIERIEDPNTFIPRTVYVQGHVQEGETTRKID
jgi:LacI family transcriptional regulator